MPAGAAPPAFARAGPRRGRSGPWSARRRRTVGRGAASSASCPSRRSAPSCRRRSSRRRSSSRAARIRRRDASSSTTRACTSAWSRALRGRELGRGGDRLQQPRVGQHGRVVDQDGDRLALALHDGHRPPRTGIGEGEHRGPRRRRTPPGRAASSRSPATGRPAPVTAARGACRSGPRRARRPGRSRPPAPRGPTSSPASSQPASTHSVASYTSSDGPLTSPGGSSRRAAAVPASTRLSPAAACSAITARPSSPANRPDIVAGADSRAAARPAGSWRPHSARSA